MTWTRLRYISNFAQALKRVVPNQPRIELPISSRYQAMIRKEFRIQGLPWLMDHDKEELTLIRDRNPKPKKRVALRQVRIAKIQKAIMENQQKQLQFRQERLNGRPLRGTDEMIAKTLPTWIKGESNLPEYMRRRRIQESKRTEGGE